jgi:predicted dehydrogenase
MNRIRVGVIGAGFGARVHAPAFRLDPRFELVGLASQTPESARAAADKAGIGKVYDSAAELVNDPGIDLVSIAVPPRAQPGLLELALGAKKHVFAEKPIGGGAALAASIAERAEALGVAHVVDFEFPEIDVFQRARAWLGEGRIGRVRHASVAWHIESYAHRHGLRDGWKVSESAGAGVLGLFLSHTFYYVEWLLGQPIASLKARLVADPLVAEDAAEDVVQASLLCGTVPVSVAASSCSRAGNGHRIEIHGDAGAIVLDNPNTDYISGFTLSLLDEPGRVAARETSALQPAPGVDGRVAAVGALLRRLGDWIERGARCSPNLGDGARIEAWLEQARTHGKA